MKPLVEQVRQKECDLRLNCYNLNMVDSFIARNTWLGRDPSNFQYNLDLFSKICLLDFYRMLKYLN